jgi:hypothetical protein
MCQGYEGQLEILFHYLVSRVFRDAAESLFDVELISGGIYTLERKRLMLLDSVAGQQLLARNSVVRLSHACSLGHRICCKLPVGLDRNQTATSPLLSVIWRSGSNYHLCVKNR